MTQEKNKIKVGSLVGCNWTRGVEASLWTNKTGLVLREYTSELRHTNKPLTNQPLRVAYLKGELFFVITNSDITQCLYDRNWVVKWFNVDYHPIQVFAENALKVILE